MSIVDTRSSNQLKLQHWKLRLKPSSYNSSKVSSSENRLPGETEDLLSLEIIKGRVNKYQLRKSLTRICHIPEYETKRWHPAVHSSLLIWGLTANTNSVSFFGYAVRISVTGICILPQMAILLTSNSLPTALQIQSLLVYEFFPSF